MSKFNLPDFSRAVTDLAQSAAPALASLDVHPRHSVSAFHWRDGLYITAEEVVDSGDDLQIVLHEGVTAKAELVGRDPSTGIALVRPEGVKAPDVFTPAKDVRAGSLAVIVGQGGTSPLVAFGTVNEAGPSWRSMRGGLIDRRIGLAAPLDGRFEGAAALDGAGALIGLVLFGPRRRPLVIPAETIERAAAALKDKGHVARGYLGAGLHPVRHASVRGAMVMSLDDDGPARAAGLHLGDIITAWDGEAIDGPRDLLRQLGPDSVGSTVPLAILRGGEKREISVTVGSRPMN
ncbi:serine protease [Mesorhizobium sp. L-8-10]|uniref:S1C family serine protease n=1 Tax=Mesorhizobium sp. L-8-10 TaxID=2744523 RepID=UPI00192599EE|nr:S1C family serine protease [Mesorhizobium sp. L-8-10]BCH30811.1 serine protease [Mesorhizobium sp. L-8-10]